MNNDTTEDRGIPLARCQLPTLDLKDARDIPSNQLDNHGGNPAGKTTKLYPDPGVPTSSATDDGALAASDAEHDIFRNYGSAEVMCWELDSEFDMSSEFELDGCPAPSVASRDISDFSNDCSCGQPNCDERFFMRFERQSLSLSEKILVFNEQLMEDVDKYQYVAKSLFVLAKGHNNPYDRNSCDGWTRHTEGLTRVRGLKHYLRAKEDPRSEDEDEIYDMRRRVRKWYG